MSTLRPKRSLSYNDLKRRRLERGSHSKNKLQPPPTPSLPQTEKKAPDPQKNTHSPDLFEHERPNEIGYLYNQIEVRNSLMTAKKKDYRQILANQTDRVLPKRKHRFLKEVEPSASEERQFSSREIVKEAIEESQRSKKILRYSELRDRVKASKEKSRSKSSNSRSRSIKFFLQLCGTPEKPQAAFSPKGVKNKLRIRKFENAFEDSGVKDSSLLRKSPQRIARMPQIKSEDITQRCERPRYDSQTENIESSISIHKQSEVFDQKQAEFYRALCSQSKSAHEGKGKDSLKKQKENVERRAEVGGRADVGGRGEVGNILGLLEVESGELKRLLGEKQLEKRRKSDLERINKRFPKGFFKF